jgi:hypothetical protein
MMHYVRGYSFSRASTVMRHQPLKYSGGVMDSSRAGYFLIFRSRSSERPIESFRWRRYTEAHLIQSFS